MPQEIDRERKEEGRTLSLALLGGGSSAHVLLGMNGAIRDTRVCSRRPQSWPVRRPEGLKREEGAMLQVYCREPTAGQAPKYSGAASLVTTSAAEAVKGADVVILCGPVAMYERFLHEIAPHVKTDAFIGSTYIQGMHFPTTARRLGIPTSCTLFGFFLYPFVSRVMEYGRQAWFYPKRLTEVAACGPRASEVIAVMHQILPEPEKIEPLTGNFTTCILNTGNSAIHPARLHGIFRDWDFESSFEAGSFPKLYADMDDYSADSIARVDAEIQLVKTALLARHPGLKLDSCIPWTDQIMRVYGEYIGDPSTLKSRFRTAKNYSAVAVPFEALPNGRIGFPRTTRMLWDDLPYGLCCVKQLSLLCGVVTPEIDSLIIWGQRVMGKEYMKPGGNQLDGRDAKECALSGVSEAAIVHCHDFTCAHCDAEAIPSDTHKICPHNPKKEYDCELCSDPYLCTC